MLVASPHSSRWIHAADSPSSASKRKRSSWTNNDTTQQMSTSPTSSWAAQFDHQCIDTPTKGKKSKMTPSDLSTSPPPPPPRFLSTASTNVPFSSAFRQANTPVRRPPTVEEQQAWSSSSSSTLPYTSSANAITENTPCASSESGRFVTAQSQWVQVQTDYGHGFVPKHSLEATMSENDYSINEGMMTLDDSSSPPCAPPSAAAAATAAASQFSIWRNIEGDTEMDMSRFDPDTSRRGDSFAWEDDILQLKVANSAAAHPHPYSPFAEVAGGGGGDGNANTMDTRSHLGASYFDQAIFPAP